MSPRLRVLFLCTGNSCRSQMAEAWARHLRGDSIEAASAGTHPQGVNPRAVQVMEEVGVDMSGARSRGVDAFEGATFDWVVTVCNAAHEACPIFPGATRTVHFGFDDPPELARGAVSEEEALLPYRRVRDEIRAFIERLPGVLLSEGSGRRPPPPAGTG